MKANCKTCRFVEYFKTESYPYCPSREIIRCHRYAPRPVDHYDSNSDDNAHFPNVIGATFCGEYEPKEEDAK